MRAVVTGAARGLGHAIAERLVDDGWSVVMADVADDLEDVARALSTDRSVVLPVAADVSDPQDVADLASVAALAFDTINLVVNNAGIGGPSLPLADSPVEGLKRVLEVNLLGPMLVTRAFLPLLRASDNASIVNMGSLFGRYPVANDAGYCASKGGLHALTEALAKELAPTIRVNAVAPGLMDTQMHWADVAARAERTGGDLETLVSEELHAVPLARHGTGGDVAAAVAWLASADASYVTGQVIAVDGGAIAR